MVVLLPLVLVGGCTTEVDCELSADCVGGECHCDVGWRGQTCSELDLVRSARAQMPSRWRRGHWWVMPTAN